MQLLLFPELELDLDRRADQMLPKIVLRNSRTLKAMDPIPAVKIIIPGFEDCDFYLHEDPVPGGDGIFCVSDPQTGGMIACGGDPLEAVNEAILTLNTQAAASPRQYKQILKKTNLEIIRRNIHGEPES